MSKKASIADKISSILSSAPASFNPDEEDNEETAAKLTEGALEAEDDDDDLLIGSFRRQNAELLEDIDSKYAGKKSSRKKLRDSDEDWESEDDSDHQGDAGTVEENEDADSNLAEEDEDDNDQENEVESGVEDDDDAEEEEDDDDEDEDGMSIDDEEGVSFDDPNFQHMKEQDIPSQMKKGLCVRNQLSMWESLLEMRIQMQKCLLAANKMPQKDHYREIAKESGNEFTSKVNETKKSLCMVLDKLMELQTVLWKKYPETRQLLKRNADKVEKNDEGSDEEIPSDTDVEMSEEEQEDDELDGKKPRKRMKLTDYEDDIKERHTKYKDYRNDVIQKWNDKTRIGTVKSATAAHSVLNQIDHILSDRPRLIKRTQTKRSNYEIIGIQEPTIEEGDSKVEVECSTEIFDDDDFYHQLLRELIEVKSAGVTDPIQLGRQWIQLQNLRSKMKRKIDTRATKGRKIRYTVHSKLVNFMAPMDEGMYTEDAKTELFSSLFGKKLGLQNNVV